MANSLNEVEPSSKSKNELAPVRYMLCARSPKRDCTSAISTLIWIDALLSLIGGLLGLSLLLERLAVVGRCLIELGAAWS